MHHVRPAQTRDYPTYTRLLALLEVDTPVLARTNWEAEMMSTTLVCEVGERVVDCVFYQALGGVGYVRQLAVDACARQQGIGRALMQRVTHVLGARGATVWHLNVKPENVAAIHLHRSMGFKRAYTSVALRFPWDALPKLKPVPDICARLVEPKEDAAVERAMGLLAGQLSDARGRAGRIIVGAYRHMACVGIAVFDPLFPGAFPFRVAAHGVRALLDGVRPFALPGQEYTGLVVDDNNQLLSVLQGAGATTHMAFDHYEGVVSAR